MSRLLTSRPIKIYPFTDDDDDDEHHGNDDDDVDDDVDKKMNLNNIGFCKSLLCHCSTSTCTGFTRFFVSKIPSKSLLDDALTKVSMTNSWSFFLCSPLPQVIAIFSKSSLNKTPDPPFRSPPSPFLEPTWKMKNLGILESNPGPPFRSPLNHFPEPTRKILMHTPVLRC